MVLKQFFKPKTGLSHSKAQDFAELTFRKYIFSSFAYLGFIELVYREQTGSTPATYEKNYLNQLISNVQLQLNVLSNREPTVSISKETIIIYLEKLLKNTYFVAVHFGRFIIDSIEKLHPGSEALPDALSHIASHFSRDHTVRALGNVLLSKAVAENSLHAPEKNRLTNYFKSYHPEHAHLFTALYSAMVRHGQSFLLHPLSTVFYSGKPGKDQKKKDSAISFIRSPQYFDIRDHVSGYTYRVYNRSNRIHHWDYYQNEIRLLQEQALMQTSSMPFKEAIFKQMLRLLRHTSLIAPGMSENKSKIELEILRLIKFFSLQSNRLKYNEVTKAKSDVQVRTVSPAEYGRYRRKVDELGSYLRQDISSNYSLIKGFIDYAYDHHTMHSQTYGLLAYLLLAVENGGRKGLIGTTTDATLLKHLLERSITGIQRSFYRTYLTSKRMTEKRVQNSFVWSSIVLGRALNQALAAYGINRMDHVYNAVVSILQHWMSSEKGYERYIDKAEFYKEFVSYLEQDVRHELLSEEDGAHALTASREHELSRMIEKVPFETIIKKPLRLSQYHSYHRLHEYSLRRANTLKSKVQKFFLDKQDGYFVSQFADLFFGGNSYTALLSSHANGIRKLPVFRKNASQQLGELLYSLMNSGMTDWEAGALWQQTVESLTRPGTVITELRNSLRSLDQVYGSYLLKQSEKRSRLPERYIFDKGLASIHPQYGLSVQKSKLIRQDKQLVEQNTLRLSSGSFPGVASGVVKDFSKAYTFQAFENAARPKVKRDTSFEFKKEKSIREKESKSSRQEVVQKTVHTVVNVEKPVNVLPQQNAVDIDRLVDKVYGEIERRIRNERQLLGL